MDVNEYVESIINELGDKESIENEARDYCDSVYLSKSHVMENYENTEH